MNKLFYFMLLIMLFVPFVYSLDKVILQIPNCFNVSVSSELLLGNFTPIKFRDCSFVNRSWICDCHNVKGVFNLTLQNDGVNLDSKFWRLYRFDVVYNVYELKNFYGKLIVNDMGGGFNIKGNSINYVEPSVLTVHDVVYVNNTVDRIVYVDRNVSYPVYVDRVVNNTVIQDVYINGEKALFTNYTCITSVPKANSFDWIVFVLAIVIIVSWEWYSFKFKKK